MLKPAFINITYLKFKQAAMHYAELTRARSHASDARTRCCS